LSDARRKHRYPEGSLLRRPWLCRECHPEWYYASAFFVALLIVSPLLGALFLWA
jgi:hypothetical protein